MADLAITPTIVLTTRNGFYPSERIQGQTGCALSQFENVQVHTVVLVVKKKSPGLLWYASNALPRKALAFAKHANRDMVNKTAISQAMSSAVWI